MKYKLLLGSLLTFPSRRLSVILIALLCVVGVANASVIKKQEKSIEHIYITIKLKDVKLEDAFSSIIEVSDLNFQYNTKIVANKKLKRNFNNASLGELLRYISKETGLNFRRVNETVYVSQGKAGSVTEELRKTSSVSEPTETNALIASNKSPNFLLENRLKSAIANMAVTVRGRILDEKGNGLPGVNIIEKGTSNGTSSDANGDYTISVSSGNAMLSFSFIGYVSKEQQVGSNTTINISLDPEDKSLDEVIVVGFGTQKKVNVTGAVSAIKIDESITNRSLSNVSSGLQGLVPGLAVSQNSGMAGRNNASLVIRGLGTVNDASPLVVVDGMPDVDINRLNMNDIESVSVLKDATSASVYGSRAANGVILITTKSGKGQERASINFTGSYAVQVPTNAYQFMPDYARALTLHQQAVSVNTLRSNYLFKDGTIDQWMALGMIDPLRYPNTDWWDIITRTGSVQNYNLSASGGGDKSNFFISVGTMNEKGLQINNDYKRYNARFNYDYKLRKNLSTGIRFQGNWSNISYALEDGFTDDDPLNTAGFDMRAAISGIVPFDPVSGYYGGVMAYNEDPQAYNPYTVYQNNLNRTNRQEANTSIYLDWQPLPGLTARIDYALNYDNQFRYSAAIPNRSYNFQTQSFGSRVYVGENAGVGNFTNTGYKTMLQARLGYQKTIAKNHDISGLFVYSEEYWYERYQASSRNDRLYPTLHEIDAALTDIQSTEGNSSSEGLRSYIGKFNYAAFDKYLFEFNFRYDGSSKFVPGSQFGFFPSVALGWRFTEETFVNQYTGNFLTNGKIRASYGGLGNNSGVGRYEQKETLEANNYMLGGSIVKGFVNQKLVNKSLSWETTNVFNLGVDLGFLNNRLTAELDYYDRLTSGMNRPSEMSLLLTGAYDAPRKNIGNLRNQGVELNLSWRDKYQGLNYGLTFNVSYNKTRLESWNEFLSKGYTFIDMPYHFLYTYQDQGVAQTWEDVFSATPQGASPGDILRKDVNGDGKIDANDKVAYPNVQRDRPTTNFGLNGYVSYKGFDLNFLISGAAGRKDYWLNIFNDVNFPTQRYASTYLHWSEPWSVENRNGSWPRLGGNANKEETTFWLDNLAYVRLKNIQLGYNLPNSWLRKIGLTSFRIFASTENIATLTKFRGLDPEKGGNRSDAYPLNKTYSMGINIGL